MPASKKAKNCWEVKSGSTGNIQIQYRVYAYDLTVRTSYIDEEQAYLNGAGIFLAVRGHEAEPIEIAFNPNKRWKKISVALPRQGNTPWKRVAGNYHDLVDAPILIGNQKSLSFEVAGIPHEVALLGDSNMNEALFTEDLKTICEKETALFGHHPCKSYLFLIHHTDGAMGGLEHMNCSSNFIARHSYIAGEKYNKAMSLLAHEYFHLWNGKRIRPVELGPFDYESENYTRLLWFVEGATSYYDDYFTYLAGIETQKEYLDIVAANISAVENRAGDQVQSLAESSFDAWIKYYRPNENTQNSQVNYYNKGAAIALALHFLILYESRGTRSLDDVIRALYDQYRARLEQGYSETELLQVFEQAAGIPLKRFFDQHIYGTVPVNYKKYFSLVGLELWDQNKAKPVIQPGWTTERSDDRALVKRVDRDTPAFRAGIYVNDELLALDGYRLKDNEQELLHGKKPGDTVQVSLFRNGRLQTIPLQLDQVGTKKYTIHPAKTTTALQRKLLAKWLKR